VAEALSGVGRAQLALRAPAAALAPLERAQAIFDKQQEVDELAAVRFSLAQALWLAPQSASDRSRAISISVQARETYAKATGPAASRKLAEVDAWLGARRSDVASGTSRSPAAAVPPAPRR
jgi:hypothetical protein